MNSLLLLLLLLFPFDWPCLKWRTIFAAKPKWGECFLSETTSFCCGCCCCCSASDTVVRPECAFFAGGPHVQWGSNVNGEPSGPKHNNKEAANKSQQSAAVGLRWFSNLRAGRAAGLACERLPLKLPLPMAQNTTSERRLAGWLALSSSLARPSSSAGRSGGSVGANFAPWPTTLAGPN